MIQDHSKCSEEVERGAWEEEEEDLQLVSLLAPDYPSCSRLLQSCHETSLGHEVLWLRSTVVEELESKSLEERVLQQQTDLVGY